MDYLQIANSWPVWLCAGACVAIIVVQAVAFAKLCYKNAPLVGLSKADCSKSFKCGMVTAIGPSLSCFIGAISMITVVGGPLAWMRLSMIGAAPTELTAATTGAAAYGVELGGAMIGVFRLLGKLDDSVLYGAALGCGICILNLFLLRFTMNRAAAATSPQAAQQIAKASVPPRLLLICVAFYLGFTLPVFNPIAVVVPFAFPRLSALLLQGVAPSFRFLRNKAADVKQALEDEDF